MKDTRILVVEDDHLAAQLYGYRLTLEGLVVVRAHNGLEALECLAGESFHAVVTDLLMPGMGGLQLIREIRGSHESWKGIPILVLSSDPNEADHVACFQSGADDFIPKPVSIPLLLERLHRLVRSRS